MSRSRTSHTLLQSLQDPKDEVAWQQFDSYYRPILINFALGLGLHEHDTEDAAQRTIMAVRHRFGQDRFDPRKGRFKSWLFGIAKFEIADLCAERSRQPIPASERSSIEAILKNIRDPDSFSDLWEDEWRAHIIRELFAHVRKRFSQRDAQIFEMLTVKAKEIAEVAEIMDLSPQAVRQVKYQVLRYMRGIKDELEMRT
ncbi:MAG: RNA polymerase sigma factor [Planctomycetota bacterium]|jgi:RNA polymerase sigma-70 factor (ECF subfamily)